MRKIVGFTILIISCIAYGVIPVIPFLPYETEQLAMWGGAVFIFAQVTWYLGLALLGREIIDYSKDAILRIKASMISVFKNHRNRGD